MHSEETTTILPERFTAIVRQHAAFLDDGDEISSDTVLVDIGVDSMATILLLVDLEEEFQVEVPEELLTPETFAIAGALWSAIHSLAAD